MLIETDIYNEDLLVYKTIHNQEKKKHMYWAQFLVSSANKNKCYTYKFDYLHLTIFFICSS